ncbi:DNA-binding response regulator [Cohnella sp. CIP 111063]|uniref:response regulator transcription factor n=1 Tax=unclassified Cohnella TaxID=2636738 RepID=UPI000B8BC023|nr:MULTISPECIES: response regulator transcription factor [unclassified Cohnella]OXS56537.1 DNA-binding response regulator [Cohnella sp. CIP 111063]PRX68716.1 DNA-binding response OmpR family regulator [Cohnella sp. SGD-V74]
MKKILIVEDELAISMVLKAYLVKAGYMVEQVFDGDEALRVFRQWKPSLVLLDVLLPNQDGWLILNAIRENSACPVIMLTALDDIEQRLRGLREGADDYLCKPFIGEEVVARVQAVLRRQTHVVTEDTAIFGQLKINYAAREVVLNGRNVILTPRDFDLLIFFSRHPNQILSREQLIEEVWGMDYDGSDRAVDLSVKRIRQLLRDWSMEEGEVATIRGLGYQFRVK